jgi:transposase InsO family protein
VAADLLNDQALPFFEKEEVRLLRVLTDRGTEYCGSLEHHEYELYLAIEDIDHTKTKARSPQTNGICERFHRTQVSMSATGNCYDNAPMKSFFSTLKCEQAHFQEYHTRIEAKTDIFAYIEGFYNRTRRHSSLGYLSP